MNRLGFLLVGFAACLAGVLSLRAEVVLPPGATWEYSFSVPPDAGWKTDGGGGFVSGAAPFGNTGGGDFGANTVWSADGSDGVDIYLRIALNLTPFDLTTLTWFLGVDNGYALYANGTLVSAANAEGFTFRWEYSGGFGATLHSGVNYLAVELEDHGGATAFDMTIEGRKKPVSPGVPDGGSTSLLLAATVAGLAALRRRL